jgi:hypothetical protein
MVRVAVAGMAVVKWQWLNDSSGVAVWQWQWMAVAVDAVDAGCCGC